MSEDRSPEQYEAVFMAIAEAVNRLPEEERHQIGAQLGEFTHDFKHLLGLVTGANAVLVRSATTDSVGARIVDMVEISDKAAMELNQFIEVIVNQLYLQIQRERE
ncbi:hypothetical protein KQH54_01275 [bacterium]|nr:hypothetical protein [bacterium]